MQSVKWCQDHPKVDRKTFVVRRGRGQPAMAGFSMRERRFVVFDGQLSNLGVDRHNKRWMEGANNGWRGCPKSLTGLL
jgi:hypothetical protein